MDKNIKIKVSESSHNNDSRSARFSISYSARKIDISQVSFEIISLLKAENDIIFEVNSTLLNMNEIDERTLNSQLVASLEEMGIEYQNKVIAVRSKKNIFSIPIEGKKRKGFELFAFIPNDIWCDQEFRKIIPKIGVRYYLPKESFENNLSAFINLDEDEKFELCRMVIFDNILFGSMGINTSIYKKNEIIELLQN